MRADRGQLAAINLKIVAAVVGVLIASLVGAFALGALGAPTVADVENRFGNVTNETTTIHTDLVVHNPNPIGVQLGDTEIEYAVRMNDVPMAEGGGTGLDVATGNSTQEFTTGMQNEQIPPWWVSHVNNGERTVVSIDATVQTSVLGERQFDVTQEREVETDLIGQFNSNETRPIEAENPPPTASNPLLYVNRTTAAWGNATAEETPIDLSFQVYNPQLEPYAVSEIGYEITMNGVEVGAGRSADPYVVEGGTTETLETRTLLSTQRLDDWWVTHLRNDQVTDLRIEFYALIELPAGQEIRVPMDALTYEETIETDIFGTKNQTADRGGDGMAQATPTPGADGSESGTPTTATDGGENETPTPSSGATATPTATPVPTTGNGNGDGNGDGETFPTDSDDGIGF
jgi:LEA14-like dessication related protein